MTTFAPRPTLVIPGDLKRHLSLPLKLILCILVLITFSSFAKTLLTNLGLPSQVAAIKAPILAGLTIYSLGKLDLFSKENWLLLVISTVSFAAPYLFISIIEDNPFIGLYYLQIYLTPLVFFVAALGVLSAEPTKSIQINVVKFMMRWNLILFLIAISLYTLVQMVPDQRVSLMGPGVLPTAWFISGGTWMRMGLPATGPNTLGLIFSIHTLLFVSLLIDGINSKIGRIENGASTKSLLIATFIALIGLLLTFSRSSMLLLFMGVPLLLCFAGVFTFSRLSQIALICTGLLFGLFAVAYFVNIASDGYLLVWLTLNKSLNDPSMMGHFSSIIDAIDRLDEYALWGYPRGSVGPKASLFSTVINGVENSVLSVIFDMGLLLGVIYYISVGTMYSLGYRNRTQLALLIGFIPPYVLLPYVFESDALMYLTFVYLAMGFMYVVPVDAIKKSKLHLRKALDKDGSA